MNQSRFPEPPSEGFSDEQRPLATAFVKAFPGVTGDTRKAIWAAYIAGAREQQKLVDSWSRAILKNRPVKMAILARAQREVEQFVKLVVG